MSDRPALRTMLLEDATRSACRNAETMARAAGCRLGRALKIEYGWSEIRFGGPMFSAQAEMMAPALSAPDIEPDDIEASDSVTVLFELLADSRTA